VRLIEAAQGFGDDGDGGDNAPSSSNVTYSSHNDFGMVEWILGELIHINFTIRPRNDELDVMNYAPVSPTGCCE
jgi:hypothetical protein